MKWISVEDDLPHIEYEKQKTWVRLKLLLEDNKIVNALGRHLCQMDNDVGIVAKKFIFYNMEGDFLSNPLEV